jgi:hypothetical protein
MGIDPGEKWASVAIGDALRSRWASASAADRAPGLRHTPPVRARVARLMGMYAHPARGGAPTQAAGAWWLGRLPGGWELFDQIPVGERGGDVDHVIVGPAGVFTVNAKDLKGKVWVGANAVRHNGYHTDFLRTSRYAATRAGRLLSAALDRTVEVRAVLAILADEWTIAAEPADVVVAAPRGVKDWLLRQPAALSLAEVREIGSAVASPSTWSAAG